jgi:Ca-activated chloride channel family protein
LLAMPQLGHAWEFDDLWWRPDQQGQRLLQAQRPAEAAEHFTDPQWQGHALYQAGDYAAAADRFAQHDSAEAHYNRGNALARAEQFEAALDAYDQALERQPELQSAQANKALIEELLRQRQAQAEASSGEQDDPQPGQEPESAAGASSAASEPQPEPSAESDAAAAKTSTEADTQAATSSQEPSAAQAQASAGAEGDPLAPSQDEERQALEQWLRQIPDDPGELLRRKFRYQQQQRQEQQP